MINNVQEKHLLYSLYFIAMQVRINFYLPRLPSGSGSEVAIAAYVPKIAVVGNKVMFDVEVGCVNE